jgi:hypothetical protein
MGNDSGGKRCGDQDYLWKLVENKDTIPVRAQFSSFASRSGSGADPSPSHEDAGGIEQ